MRKFTATFHTHLSALMTGRTLEARGIRAQLAPVPRALSSSCGTCIRYAAEEAFLDAMDEDVEAVYEETADGYRKLYENL